MNLSMKQKWDWLHNQELILDTMAEECRRLKNFHSKQNKKESVELMNFYDEKAIDYGFDAMMCRMAKKKSLDTSKKG